MDRPSSSSAPRSASDGWPTRIGLRSGRRQAFLGHRQQPAVVERPVGEADQRFAAAAVVPAEHGRGQVLGGMVEEAVAGQVVLDHLAGFLDQQFLFLVGRLPGREEIGRRKLHLVADDDRLRGAEDRGHRLFQRDLAGFVEDDHVEIGGVHRERVGDAQRAHQPHRLQVLDHLARIAGDEIADRLVSHRLAELVLQVAPAAAVPLLEFLFLVAELRGRQPGDADVLQESPLDSVAEFSRIAREPLAVEPLQAAGVPVADAAGEVGKLAFLAIGVGQAAIGRGRLDLRRFQRQHAQGGPERRRQGGDLGEALEKGRQIVQGRLHLLQLGSQLIERTVCVLVHDLVQLGGQRAERLVGLDHLGDDLRRLRPTSPAPRESGQATGPGRGSPAQLPDAARSSPSTSPSSRNCSAIVFRCRSSLSSSSYSFCECGKHLRPARANDVRAEVVRLVQDPPQSPPRRPQPREEALLERLRLLDGDRHFRRRAASAARPRLPAGPRPALPAGAGTAAWASANCRAAGLSESSRSIRPIRATGRDLLGIVHQQPGRRERLPLLARHAAAPQARLDGLEMLFRRLEHARDEFQRVIDLGQTAATVAEAGAWPGCRRGGCLERSPPARRSVRGDATTRHSRAGVRAPSGDSSGSSPRSSMPRRSSCRRGMPTWCGEPCMAASNCSSG